MAALDWITLGTYLIGLIVLSFAFRKRQTSSKEYYLANNDLSPWPIALSTAATQCSTNSLLGAPAFVAFTGGLLWLQYELAVPLAMAVLMVVFFPIYRQLNLFSVYDYIERRFGVPTRLTLSILFQCLRAFSTGVTIFGISLVLEYILGISFTSAVILLGIFTIVYDVIGGMRAVIWSDVIQLGILWGSVVFACYMGLQLNGGWEATWSAFVATGNAEALDFQGWGMDGNDFGFWPMLIGGFFLYVSYYGCDQTQAQRELSTRSVADSRRSLFMGGLIRFPLVLTYCFLGVCIGAYVIINPDFVQSLVTESGKVEYNLAVPIFVLQNFPVVLKGFVIAGLFAAAMSSLDSTINALSLLSYQDVVQRVPRARAWAEKHEIWAVRGLTVFWGVVCLIFTFQVGAIADTVIESVNKIGSLLNGPLLGVFVLGLFFKKVGQTGALLGLALGFIGNLVLWQQAPDLSWLWWNPIGFLVVILSGILVAKIMPSDEGEPALLWYHSKWQWWSKAKIYVAILCSYTLLLLLIIEWISE